MIKVLKWAGIVVGIVIGAIIALLVIIPQVIDINEYKPGIERMVSGSTGRDFSIGGEIDLTLFPWAGVLLSDVHLGNAKGFEEKDFVSVEHFEVRVKLLPLIFKNFQVKRFIVKRPRIVLERKKAGQGNWKDFVKSRPPAETETKPAPEKEGPPVTIKNLMVGEFAITGGELLWIDRQKGTERRLTDVTVGVDPITPTQPIGFQLSAQLDGQPLTVTGEAGPLPTPLGEGKVPVLLKVRAFDALVGNIQGFFVDLGRKPRYVVAAEIEQFSPREVAEKLGIDLSHKTRDPEALTKMSLKTTVAGTLEAVALKDGLLKLDDSTLTFDVDASEFERPVLAFDLNLDTIDIDRYLAPPAEAKEQGKPTPAPQETVKESEEPDYSSLRKLVMDGTIRIGELRVRGANLSDIALKVKARNGIIRVDPFSMNLYQGTLAGKLMLNVQEKSPTFKTAQNLKDVQVGPLLKDLGYTDRLEGVMDFEADIGAKGTEPEEIKRTLNGTGQFALTDGAIVGFDLAQMVRNIKAAFGLGEKQKPRTEFSELKGNFTITNGLLDNPLTYLASPFLRVEGKGRVDLARETIDYRVEPRFVGTLKGQGDKKGKSGLMVPVVISGTFSDPKFQADLSAMLEDETVKEGVRELLEDLIQEDEEDSARSEGLKLLEGLIFGE